MQQQNQQIFGTKLEKPILTRTTTSSNDKYDLDNFCCESQLVDVSKLFQWDDCVRKHPHINLTS